MTVVRKAAVAGMFYPDKIDELKKQVGGYLDAVAPVPDLPSQPPKAIIAPHAGYVYSGPIAASVYARLRPARDIITRVVLLGPCHRVAVRGLALAGADAYGSPLGDVAIDKEAEALVSGLDFVGEYEPTHRHEHSLEVHLPFLQTVLGDFKLVPFVVGLAPAKEIATVLDALWGGPETLIVISSDLSHYLEYTAAQTLDARTSRAIETLDLDGIKDEGACGRLPVRGLMYTAKKRGMTVRTLDLRNSGDTAGPRNQVVGYGSWAFYEQPS